MFHFDQKRDKKARDLLFSYRKSFPIEPLLREIEDELRKKQKTPLFFGAGPNLETLVKKYLHILLSQSGNFFIVSADGATNCLLKYDIMPDIVCSDLDGISLLQLEKVLGINQGLGIKKERGEKIPLFLIHAHGDNIDKLNEFSSILKRENRIIGTTQVKPKIPIINPGGFTDGDRGLYFCHYLCPINRPFWLFGYDFEGKIGKFSKNKFNQSVPLSKLKKKKLNFAKELIGFLQNKMKRKVIYIPDEEFKPQIN